MEMLYYISFLISGILLGIVITGLYMHEKQFNRELDDISRTHHIIWESMMREKEYNKLVKENEKLKEKIINEN